MKMCKMKDYKGDVDWESVDQGVVFIHIRCMEAYLSQMLKCPEHRTPAVVLQSDLDDLKYVLGVKPEDV